MLEEKQKNVAKTHDLIFLYKQSTQLTELDVDNNILKRLNELSCIIHNIFEGDRIA